MISLAHPYIMGAAQGVQTSLRVIVGFVMRNIERPPVWYSLFKIYHRGLKTGILLLDYCRRSFPDDDHTTGGSCPTHDIDNDSR